MSAAWRAAARAVFVDSSGFYALASHNDPYHRDATAVVAAVGARARLLTTNFILAEAHALFLARAGRRSGVDFLQRLRTGTVRIERVTEADETEAEAIIAQYADKEFSYTDATSFAVMRRFGLDVALTSDRNFVQYGFVQARA